MSGLKVDIGDEVESGGKNFSSGERQVSSALLILSGRALTVVT